jgi:hypothetical protein
MFDGQVFWKDTYDGKYAEGGFFIRAFDLKKFLEKVEASENGGEVVGLKFEGNNLEIIVNPKK